MTEGNIHTGASMTIAEVASLYRVSRRTVERWIAKGDLPAFKLPGGLVRIETAAVNAIAEVRT